MNNIAQHFATAWMRLHIKGDAAMAAYLDLVPTADDSVWALDDARNPKPEPKHNHRKGFQERTAKGLRYKVLPAGQ